MLTRDVSYSLRRTLRLTGSRIYRLSGGAACYTRVQVFGFNSRGAHVHYHFARSIG